MSGDVMTLLQEISHEHRSDFQLLRRYEHFNRRK